MSKMKLIIAAILTILVLTLTFVWFSKKDDSISKSPENQIDQSQLTFHNSTNRGEFKLEPQIFSDPSYNNLEVIELPDNRFRMFFHQFDKILSAISDDGQKFTLEPGIVLENAEMPATVRLANSQFRMYFVDGHTKNLKSAISNDGLNFDIEEGVRLEVGEGNALDRDGIIHPSIVRLDNGSYKMFYDGVRSDKSDDLGWTILSASSADGLTWTKDSGKRIDDEAYNRNDPDYEIDMAFSSHIEFTNQQFILSLTVQSSPLAYSGIWQATSSDGLNFSNLMPLLARDPGLGNKEDFQSQSGPSGMPQDPFILNFPDGSNRLFYWVGGQNGGTFSALQR